MFPSASYRMINTRIGTGLHTRSLDKRHLTTNRHLT